MSMYICIYTQTCIYHPHHIYISLYVQVYIYIYTRAHIIVRMLLPQLAARILVAFWIAEAP